MIKISPSILACDFSRLGEEIESIRIAGAEMAHLDVMDGIFVTNISFGLPVIESIRKSTEMFLDVHLMITKPERYIDRFIDAGADLVTFHVEATDCPDKCIEIIKSRGKKAAISVKPNTPIEEIYPFLDSCDMILVMTVEPGFGGQKFRDNGPSKIAAIRKMISASGRAILISVDGGINRETGKMCVDAGADVLVAGSYLFRFEDMAPEIALWKQW